MKRILFPTLLIATLLAGGLVALAIWRTPVTAEEFVSKAKVALQEKKVAEATILLLNAVQADERNRDARLLLAQTYESQGELLQSAKQLQALLEYYPKDNEVRLKLGNLYLKGGRADIDQSRQLAKAILAEEGNDSNIDALNLWGNASARLGEFSESVTAFEKIISLDPKNVSAYISLGTSHVMRNNFPEAEQAFLKARELDPKGKTALLSLANYYRVKKDLKKAEEIYKTAVDLFPGDPLSYTPLVAMYNDVGRFDEGVTLLNTIQAKNPKDPTPSLVLADFLLLRKQDPDAQRVLLDAKKENPTHLGLAGKLAAVIMRSDPKRAREEVDLILKENPKSPVGMVLLGETQFWAGELEPAKATLSDPVLANHPEAQYYLGAIAVKQGQVNPAEEYYRKALQLNGNYLLARSALAGLLIDKGRITDARAEVARVLEADKNYTPARLVKIAIDIREQRFEGVEQELLAIAKDQPTNAEVQKQLGVYYATRGRTADAEKAFVRALELQPDAPERLQMLVQFYAQTKQTDKAIQRLTAVPEENRRAYHYEWLGSVYSQMGKSQEAEAAYTKALEKDPKSNADAAIAALYIQTGRTEEGLRKLDELIKKNPSNAGAYTIKGMIYENQGKASDAKESYTRALQIDSNSDVAANNLAYMLAEQNQDLETALTWAQSAKKRQPELAGIADTLGWVYYKLGNHVLARDQLQFAASKEPNNPIFQYHLGMIYLGTKQSREAADALRKAANSTTQFKEKSLAQAALREATK